LGGVYRCRGGTTGNGSIWKGLIYGIVTHGGFCRCGVVGGTGWHEVVAGIRYRLPCLGNWGFVHQWIAAMGRVWLMKWEEVVPVVASVVLIIVIAVLQKYNKLFAAITATMPVTIPLALWIVYTGAKGNVAVVSQFSLGMFLAILPTVAFLLALWLAARAGMKLLPMIVVGYAVWGVGVLLLTFVRHLFGFD
jgi:hypothetical protein